MVSRIEALLLYCFPAAVKCKNAILHSVAVQWLDTLKFVRSAGGGSTFQWINSKHRLYEANSLPLWSQSMESVLSSFLSGVQTFFFATHV